MRPDLAYVLDYGEGPFPYDMIIKYRHVRPQCAFVVISVNNVAKPFYFDGDDKFFRYLFCQVEQNVTEINYRKNEKAQIISLGTIASVFTKNFEKDELANAIRKDYLKYHQNFRLNEDFYNTITTSLFSMSGDRDYLAKFKQARALDLDVSSFFMKRRQKALQKLHNEIKRIGIL